MFVLMCPGDLSYSFAFALLMQGLVNLVSTKTLVEKIVLIKVTKELLRQHFMHSLY